MKIGILYICTGNYHEFFEEFYQSAKKYFIPEEEKHFFVFASQNFEKFNKSDITFIPQHQWQWPDVVLQKFHYFLQVQNLFTDVDYLICFNANLVFQNQILGKEFLPDAHDNYLVGVNHPSHFNKSDNTQFIYDRQVGSTAYIESGKGKFYYQSAIFGGRKQEFLELCRVLRDNVEIDYANNIVALWHDESHVNKYFLDNPPKTLSPGFLYPENRNLPVEKRIIQMDKNQKGFSYFRMYNTKNNKNKKSVFYRVLSKIKNSL